LRPSADIRILVHASFNDEALGAAVPTVANVLLSNAHRKKVIHNLVYRHDDFPAASAAWGSLFPQTFCIDEDAGHILTISDPGVVSIYDWDTGA